MSSTGPVDEPSRLARRLRTPDAVEVDEVYGHAADDAAKKGGLDGGVRRAIRGFIRLWR
jgi:hypothetical protein